MTEGVMDLVKPPRPLPTAAPFLSFYTPTFRRPTGLAKCLASVATQTAVERVEQLVVPDHAGLGVTNGLYGRMPFYAEALRGDYVHVLCDDDELASPTAVEQVERFAAKMQRPAVIVVRARKGNLDLPLCPIETAPVCGRIDLSCYIIRQDVWLRHYKDYGLRYEGDYDHALALWNAGHRHEFLDMLFVVGGASNGRPEVDW